jgi:hypothetical protein
VIDPSPGERAQASPTWPLLERGTVLGDR